MHLLRLPCTLIQLIGFSVLITIFSSPAQANVGPDWWGGYGAEPIGGVKDIAITRETLDLDLRPLAERRPVRVEATYHLHNMGGRQTLRPVFVAGSNEISEFAVHMNERSISSTRLPDKLDNNWSNLSGKWNASQPLSVTNHPPLPKFNPSAMQSAAHFGGTWYPMALVAFSVEIPPGRSTLRASYCTKAVGTDEKYPTATWHIPYVLAPARAWQRFGGLDVTVTVPEGWESLCTLSLDRHGNELRGSFDGLPADVLVVSARLPVGPEHERRITLYTVLYVLIVAAGGIFCGGWGRWVGRWLSHPQHWGIRVGLYVSIPCTGLVWAMFVYGAWKLAIEGILGPIALQVSPYYYGHFMMPAIGSFLLGLSAIPLGGVLSAVMAVMSMKKKPERTTLGFLD